MLFFDNDLFTLAGNKYDKPVFYFQEELLLEMN